MVTGIKPACKVFLWYVLVPWNLLVHRDQKINIGYSPQGWKVHNSLTTSKIKLKKTKYRFQKGSELHFFSQKLHFFRNCIMSILVRDWMKHRLLLSVTFFFIKVIFCVFKSSFIAVIYLYEKEKRISSSALVSPSVSNIASHNPQ